MNVLMALFAKRHQIAIVVSQPAATHRIVCGHERNDVMNVLGGRYQPFFGTQFAERIVHEFERAQMLPPAAVVDFPAFGVVLTVIPGCPFGVFFDRRHSVSFYVVIRL